MITSPIDPMQYWKLEEIQRMLNKIEGYENVVIEFRCQRADGYGPTGTFWNYTYGIKEQLVNGQYNWLLKHKFVIEEKTELDAHNLAWQEAAERLVIDVWRTSINSFRKQQRELKASEKQNVGLPKWKNNLTEDYLKLIDGVNTMYKQPKTKPWLRQAWYWLRGTLALSVMVGACCLIAINKTAMDIFTWSLGLGLIGGLVYCFKVLMGAAFKDDGFEN
jgi:hypothetical protein